MIPDPNSKAIQALDVEAIAAALAETTDLEVVDEYRLRAQAWVSYLALRLDPVPANRIATMAAAAGPRPRAGSRALGGVAAARAPAGGLLQAFLRAVGRLAEGRRRSGAG